MSNYIITEKELFEYLDNSKNVLLIEPPYKRQYIPIGLGKIASYIKSRGGNVTYSRKSTPGKFDLICITTLFTTDSRTVINEIHNCQQSLFLRNIPILIGGIFASLMPEYIYENTGINSFVGYSKKLDECVPDYSIDWKVNGFFKNALTVFTTRGCPNKCGYCMVWRMEPNFYVQKKWRENLFIDREITVISDNNLLSASIEHLEELVKICIDKNKKVIFNNGVDCRLINDDIAKLLSKLTYTRQGFRTAFDRMSDDGHYQKAMETLIKNGCKIKGNSYTYVLYNFDDTPQEAYYRAKECWKFGSNPYLMRYRPLNRLQEEGKSYIGKHWTKNLIIAFNHYGQNYGYNRGDRTFENWMKSSNIELTKEDWEAWYYEK